MMNEMWDLLFEYSRMRFNTGQRRIVPIVASGFNLQASGRADDWYSLLSRVAITAGLANPLNEIDENIRKLSMTAIWEWFVIEYKKIHPNLDTGTVERQLKKNVINNLRDFEDKNRNQPFYKEFLNLGFKDIISFNFDRTLSLQYNDSDKVIKLSPSRSFYAQTSLFRHSVQNSKYRTIVWYPHGDTENYRTIKLGIRSYGIYIRSLSSAFNAYRKRKSQEDKKQGFEEWSNKVRSLPFAESNWLWIGMTSPLLILGSSMSRDEWPFWWFLHQRARHLAHYKGVKIKPVFVLWKKNKRNTSYHNFTQWLQQSPVGIKLLLCDDWPEGWGRIRTINKT